MSKGRPPTDKMISAGLLTWLLPGAGHWWLGHRALGVVFCVAISFAFFTGLALGGMKDLVNPVSNRWLFLAELGTGGYTVGTYLVNMNTGELRPGGTGLVPSAAARRELEEIRQREGSAAAERRYAELYNKYVSFYPASNTAQIYLAAAGLLNILAILDALTRAQTGGLPTYYRELAGKPAEGQEEAAT